MKNKTTFSIPAKLSALSISWLLLFSTASFADTDTQQEKQVEKELEKTAKASKKRLKRSTRGPYKKVTLSKDKTYYTVDGKEEVGPNPVDGEQFYIRYDRKKYEGEDSEISYRIKNFNKRDGFYLAYSVVSSSGDDLYSLLPNNESELDDHFSYRIQIVGLFVESPGLNSRRIHGLYASNAWGVNFYNGDNWSLDIYKQFNTEKVEGVAEIQTRNLNRRAGVRATGYFDNSQLQFIYSPYAEDTGNNSGIEASLSYTHYWQIRNLNIYGSLGAQYQSEQVVDFYQPNQVADQDRVNTAAELGFEYALNKDWVLGGFASYSELPSNVSTIEDSVTGSRAGLSITFVF